MKKLISILLCVLLLTQAALAANTADAAKAAALSAAAGEKALAGVEGNLLSQQELFPAGSSVCDWTAIAYAMLGVEDDTAAYLAAENAYISERFAADRTGRDPYATEWQRAALTVRALGGDPTKAGTEGKIDLIAGGTYNFAGKSLDMQGLNGYIFALIALDSGEYKVPENARYTREDILNAILSAQEDDGGFGLVPGASDADITAMALQAIAPYADGAARDAVEKGVSYLAGKITDEALFEYAGSPTSESSSQVIIALCSLGVDPTGDERFIKDGISVVDALIKNYQRSDGSFAHLREDADGDFMATEQAMLALTAVWKYRCGGVRLYDMVTQLNIPTETTETAAAENESTGGNTIVIIGAAAVAVIAAAVVTLKHKKEKNS